MKNVLSKLNKLGLLIYSFGISLILFIFVISVWTDFESINLDRYSTKSNLLTTLRCPVLITTNESEIISIKVINNTDRVTRPALTTIITKSTVSILNTTRSNLELQPGTSQIVTRDIKAEDSVYGSMILVKAWVDYPYPEPNKQSVCGVYVLDIDFLSGNQLTNLIIATSLISIFLGLFLFSYGHGLVSQKIMRKRKVYTFLALEIFVLTIICNFGYWLIGIFGLLFTVIFGDGELTIQD